MNIEPDAELRQGAAFVDAGPFSHWLRSMRAVLRDEQDADVPCGDCVGCCVSSYPIPLRPTDRIAQQEVPEQFLLQVAGLAPGHLMMGFREDGSCPFLLDRACTIYTDRPRTCRDYDCRIYAAAGLRPVGDRPIIRNRVGAWRFTYPTQQDQQEAVAVRRAADFITLHQQLFPAAMRAGSPTAAAVLAIKTYRLFLPVPPAVSSGESGDEALVGQIAAAAREFEARG
jgi:hypothetical protein